MAEGGGDGGVGEGAGLVAAPVPAPGGGAAFFAGAAAFFGGGGGAAFFGSTFFDADLAGFVAFAAAFGTALRSDFTAAFALAAAGVFFDGAAAFFGC